MYHGRILYVCVCVFLCVCDDVCVRMLFCVLWSKHARVRNACRIRLFGGLPGNFTVNVYSFVCMYFGMRVCLHVCMYVCMYVTCL